MEWARQTHVPVVHRRGKVDRSNVNDSGIRILDVMVNNPKSYQWDKDEDYHYPGHGHEPIAPPLCGQETILSAVAAHPTCDFEYCAGGPNTLSYFRFRTYK